jgi:hypothetical protein
LQTPLNGATHTVAALPVLQFSEQYDWEPPTKQTPLLHSVPTAQGPSASSLGVPEVPDVLPEVLPDVLPDVLPEVLPDVLPAPDVLPELVDELVVEPEDPPDDEVEVPPPVVASLLHATIRMQPPKEHMMTARPVLDILIATSPGTKARLTIGGMRLLGRYIGAGGGHTRVTIMCTSMQT